MYFVIVLGFATGCRAMTPIAVLCWYMWLAKLPVTGLNFWEANIVAVAVFSFAALGEYVGDTLPKTPSRTSWFPLLARLVLGMFVGMSVFSSFMEPLAGGLVFGGVGALIGAFVGYTVRMRCAQWCGKDFPVAITESALTLAVSVFAMHRIAADWARQSVIPH